MTREQERQWLIDHGYNPEEHQLAIGGKPIEYDDDKVAPAPVGPITSKKEGFLRPLARSVAPGLAATAAGAGTLSLATAAGGPITWPVAAGSLVTALGAGYLANLAQEYGLEKIQGTPAYREGLNRLALARKEHPVLSVAGELAGGVGPYFGPSQALKAGKALALLPNVASRAEGGLSRVGRQALYNTGLNAAIGAGTEGFNQVLEDDFQPTRLAAATIGGGLLSHPWGIGRKFFPQARPSVAESTPIFSDRNIRYKSPAMREAARAAFNDPTQAGAAWQKVASDIDELLASIPRSGKKNKVDLARGPEGSIPIERQLTLPKEHVYPGDEHVLSKEYSYPKDADVLGNQPPAQRPEEIAAIDQAVRAERLAAEQAAIEAKKASAISKEQEALDAQAAQLRIRQDTARAKAEAEAAMLKQQEQTKRERLAKGIETKKTKKQNEVMIASLKKAMDTAIIKGEAENLALVKAAMQDIDTSQLSPSEQSALTANLAKLLEVYHGGSSAKGPKAPGLLQKAPPTAFQKLQEFLGKRGVSKAESVAELPILDRQGNPTGKFARGSARVNKPGVREIALADSATTDTPIHEGVHWYIRDSLESKKPAESRFMRTALKKHGWDGVSELNSQNMIDAEEALATALGQEGYERMFAGQGEFKKWWRATKANLKEYLGGDISAQESRDLLSHDIEKGTSYKERKGLVGKKVPDIATGDKSPELYQPEDKAVPYTSNIAKALEKKPTPELQTGPVWASMIRARAKDTKGAEGIELYQGEYSLPIAKSEIEAIRKVSPEVADTATKFYSLLRLYTGKFENSFLLKLRQTDAFPNWMAEKLGRSQLADTVYAKMRRQMHSNTPETFTPEEQVIADTIQESLDQVYTEHSDRVPAGVFEPIEQIPYYVPEVLSAKSESVMRKGAGPEFNAMKADFFNNHLAIVGDPDKAKTDWITLIKGYAQENPNISAGYGPLDKARGIPLPDSMVEKSATETMRKYLSRVGRRFAYHDTFETNPEVQEMLNEGLATNTNVKNVMRNVAGIKTASEIRRDAALGLTKAALMGPLTGTVDVASGLGLIAQHMDASQYPGALKSALANWRANREAGIKQGIISYNMTTYDQPGNLDGEAMADGLRALTHIANAVQGRTALEQMGRTTIFGMGKFLAENNLTSLLNGRASGQQQKMLRDFAKEFLPDAQARGYFELDELNEIAARVVESVQGMYDYRGLPAVAVEGSLAPFLALARWNIEKSNNFMRFVVNPAMKGNFKPLLMQTLGVLGMGAVVQQIREQATGRKQKTPTVAEVSQGLQEGAEDAYPALFYKLAGLATAAGYAGILSDVAKSFMDVTFHNKPQAITNPLVNALGNGFELGADAIEAAQNGDLDADGMVALLAEALKQNIQAYRVIIAQGAKMGLAPETAQQSATSDKMRDLKMFKEIHGMKTPVGGGYESNPLLNRSAKQFKRTEDLGQARELLQDKLLPSIRDQYKQHPGEALKRLGGLRRNSYQTIPSPGVDPRLTRQYLNWVMDTGGDRAGLVADYQRKNAINRAKTAMVPRP